MKSIGINLNLRTIQAIRLVHSLMETDYSIGLRSEELEIINFLKRFFNIDFEPISQGTPIVTDIFIDHKTPRCTIGSINRTLIFPNSMLDLCKSKWNSDREITYLFTGLLSPKRLTSIHDWILSHSASTKLISHLNYLLIRTINDYVQKRSEYTNKGASGKFSVKIYQDEKFLITPSTIGRNFPEKAWDDKYFNQMANAKFVICPNGDFVWTYRFFEAIICGAIPIVESDSPVYSGFYYYKMWDQTERYIYDEAIVLKNYDLIRSKLTIQKEILNREIGKLLLNK